LSASAKARRTTSGFVYQLVEPASSSPPQSLFGHHFSPMGVSIWSPVTQGLPLQSFQFSGEHSALAAAAKPMLRLVVSKTCASNFTPSILPIGRPSSHAGRLRRA
jgi:hypothetical protein